MDTEALIMIKRAFDGNTLPSQCREHFGTQTYGMKLVLTS